MITHEKFTSFLVCSNESRHLTDDLKVIADFFRGKADAAAKGFFFWMESLMEMDEDTLSLSVPNGVPVPVKIRIGNAHFNQVSGLRNGLLFPVMDRVRRIKASVEKTFITLQKFFSVETDLHIPELIIVNPQAIGRKTVAPQPQRTKPLPEVKSGDRYHVLTGKLFSGNVLPEIRDFDFLMEIVDRIKAWRDLIFPAGMTITRLPGVQKIRNSAPERACISSDKIYILFLSAFR